MKFFFLFLLMSVPIIDFFNAISETRGGKKPVWEYHFPIDKYNQLDKDVSRVLGVV